MESVQEIKKFELDSFRYSRGYTLLFAVLTAALVLGVAVFILSISRGQYLLASTARESTYAFYAADSGIECAAKIARDLATTTGTLPNITPAGAITCAGSTSIDIPAWDAATSNVNGLSGTHVTSVTVKLVDTECANITFVKGIDTAGNSVTQIESRGYNYCKLSAGIWTPDTSNPKVVERAIRLTYTGM